MSSEVKVPNLNCVDATIGEFENIVPQKGAIYAADGQVYTKFPSGIDGQILTADSTQTQGVSWQNHYNTFTFHLSGRIPFRLGYNSYASIGYLRQDTRALMCYNHNVYVIDLGVKPSASTKYGEWCGNNPGITDFTSMWVGELRIDVVGCSDSADPNSGLNPIIVNVPTPHFTILDTEIRARTTYMSKYWTAPTPILVPAFTKFSLRTTWSPNTQFNNDLEHELTMSLILRAVL